MSHAIRGRLFDGAIKGEYSCSMTTITIPKEKYKILEKQAALYRGFLKSEALFPIERYTPERVKEFLKEDRISPEIQRKAKMARRRKIK